MAFVISFCSAACQRVVVFVCNNLITSRGIWLKERSLHVRTKYTGGWNHVNGWLFFVLSLAMIHLTVLKLLTTFFFDILFWYLHILQEMLCWIQQANTNSMSTCSFFRKMMLSTPHLPTVLSLFEYFHILEYQVLQLLQNTSGSVSINRMSLHK